MHKPKVRETTKEGHAMQSRSVATRRRILEAATEVLADCGLAGASTLRIQQRAEVSRGRLLHHFPSRQVLLVASIDHVATERFEHLSRRVEGLSGSPRISETIRLLWSTHEGALFWAALELWLGARNDKALRNALLPQERRLGALIRSVCDELFGEELVGHPLYPMFVDVLLTSMRGAAITHTFDRRYSLQSNRHVQLWTQLAHELFFNVDEG
jgi:AcrR family transcriptional regulator